MFIYWTDGSYNLSTWNDGTSLYHHGIAGQKWGVRNGPPYPLDYKEHSKREMRREYQDTNYKKRLDKDNKSIKSKRTRSVADQVEFEDRLKTLGIVAGTAAAAVMIGYLEANPNNMFTDYNASLSPFLYKVTNNKFLNPSDGSAIGTRALEMGYRPSNASDITNAINHADRTALIDIQNNMNDDGPSLLCNTVRTEVRDSSAPRRLSCWSASNAYYMSMLTGNTYASKSFDNLVDFNSFGDLYKTKPTIFNIGGELSSNFVGKYGNYGGRCETDDSRELLHSIAKNIKLDGNGTDGLYTVGFINAGYRGVKCTHQFNFDILKGSNGENILHIADGYTGRRYKVCTIEHGSIGKYYFEGFDEFAREMHHYNKDSVRFYAPSLNSVNPNVISNVILSKNETIDQIGSPKYTHSLASTVMARDRR